MTTVSELVRSMINAFHLVEDAPSQDALLHCIFKQVYREHEQYNSKTRLDVCMTLCRLYSSKTWEPARTYLFLIASVMMGPTLDNIQINVSHYVGDPEVGPPILDPRTIHGECMLKCSIFNDLCYDGDSYYGDETSSESESESGSEASEEDSPEHSDHSLSNLRIM